jgi:dTMP kinase
VRETTLPDNGRLIAFDGVEGAGKSTQIELVAAALRREGYTVVETREPGGTALGARIRQIVMHASPAPSPMTELLLYLADRAQHLAEVVLPALERGQIVLSDRFSASTLVYQGHARRLGIDRVRQLDATVRNDIRPALTVILDCPVETGLQRARGDDRFHREQLDFHQRVRQGFLALAEEDPAAYAVIDATLPAAEVTKRILERVRTCLQAG